MPLSLFKNACDDTQESSLGKATRVRFPTGPSNLLSNGYRRVPSPPSPGIKSSAVYLHSPKLLHGDVLRHRHTYIVTCFSSAQTVYIQWKGYYEWRRRCRSLFKILSPHLPEPDRARKLPNKKQERYTLM